MKIKITIDYVAVALSVIGSFMVSLPHDWQRLVGFILFMIANICWIKFCGLRREFRSVMILNVLYLISSLIGIYNNH